MTYYLATFGISSYSVFLKRKDSQPDINSRCYLRCFTIVDNVFDSFTHHFDNLASFSVNDHVQVPYDALFEYIKNFENAFWPCLVKESGQRYETRLGFVFVSKDDLMKFKLMCPYEVTITDITHSTAI